MFSKISNSLGFSSSPARVSPEEEADKQRILDLSTSAIRRFLEKHATLAHPSSPVPPPTTNPQATIGRNDAEAFAVCDALEQVFLSGIKIRKPARKSPEEVSAKIPLLFLQPTKNF